jgi:hypothetical protein
MTNTIIICLTSLTFCVTLTAQDPIALVTGDRIRTAQMQEQAHLNSIKQHEREVRAREAMQQRQFEVKFNQLVDAVSVFARRYNEGKGSTWPNREASQLRKAMRQLQSAEKSLGGTVSSKQSQDDRPEPLSLR